MYGMLDLGSLLFVCTLILGKSLVKVFEAQRCTLCLGHIEGESAGNPEETLVSSVSIREEGVRDNLDC